MKNEKLCSQLSTYFKRRMDLGIIGIVTRGLSEYAMGSWKD
jgi:hypothetical protein